jgi:hypothetical protein
LTSSIESNRNVVKFREVDVSNREPENAMVKRKVIAAINLLAAFGLLTFAFQGSALAQCTTRTPQNCGHSDTPAAPELDPNTVGAALVAFGAASALIVERYKRRKR